MTAHDPLKPWEYWKEPDFPKCEHDPWGGVNSDPDHCIDCCDRTIKYLLSKITRPSSVEALSAEEAEALARVKRNLAKSLYIGKDDAAPLVALVDRLSARPAPLSAEEKKAMVLPCAPGIHDGCEAGPRKCVYCCHDILAAAVLRLSGQSKEGSRG